MKYRHLAVVVAATAAVVGRAQAVTDTVFQYSSAKTGWLTINPTELTPESNVITYSASNSSLAISGGVIGCFYSALHLPQGAKIGQVAIWYLSDAGGSDIQFQLTRTSFANGATDIAFKNVHDDSFTRKVAFLVAPVAWATVSNGSYKYDFVYCPQSNDNIFYGGRVTYTYTQAGD